MKRSTFYFIGLLIAEAIDKNVIDKYLVIIIMGWIVCIVMDIRDEFSK